jgi:hypothetical protein
MTSFDGEVAMMNGIRLIRRALLPVLVACAGAAGQTKPWDLFTDTQSSAACDVVNAANGELVVLTSNSELTLVSGTDVTLPDTFVDASGNVFYLGNPAGLIDFATDGDGLRSLWWLAITGQVVSVDGFTGEPTVTTMRPTDFQNVPCDACNYWDDQSVCTTPPATNPPPVITISICGANAGMAMALTAVGLGLMGITRRRRSL